MKIAVITGASTGIGQTIAVELAKTNIYVLLIARNEKKLEETLKLVEETGGKGKYLICDLSNIESLNQLISNIKSETNNVDILCNVAGMWHGKDKVYADTDFEKFDQNTIVDTYTVGITAPTLLSHALIPLMRKGSKIINVSGTFENGAKGWLPYYVSKKAIEDLTIGLSQELSDKDIQVNCISPSDTATEEYKKYFPQYIEDAVDPLEIAKYVLYLCSDKAENINGKIKVIKRRVMPDIIKEVGFDFHWEEEKVWALELPVEEMPITDLEWHFDIPFWFLPGGYYDLKPRDVINNPRDHLLEYGRTMASDLNYPLDIMNWRGRWLLLDGLHRLVKAYILGWETIKVRKVSQQAIPRIS